MPQPQYNDQELAALLVLLFKVTSDDIETFNDAGSQIKTYKNALQAQPAENSDFGRALRAFVEFYDADPGGAGKFPNRYMVTAMRQSLAAVLAGMAATELWGECRHVGHDQVVALSGLGATLVKPQSIHILGANAL